MSKHVYADGTPKYSASELSHINPSAFVNSCFKAYGINPHLYDNLALKSFFLDTTEEHYEAYDPKTIQAIRRNDVRALKSLRSAGCSFQGCNRFGESLLHLACRRSSLDVIRFLIVECSVSLRVRDDYGRTPLHDVCWRKEPNFDIMNIILDQEPDLLLIADRRGHVPLDYARREHWGHWIHYLAVRMKREIKIRLST